MTLEIVWFVVVAGTFSMFLVLDGFDFGVGMLHAVVGRSDVERRVAINSIGSLWDGNEVWLILAATAMFAAFPGWYATMFSAFYLALVILLVSLIVRGVSFEYRGKGHGERWRSAWDRLMTASSCLAPFVIGVALGDLLHGVPIGANHEYAGGFLDLFTPYALFVGLTITLLCALHGSTYLALKTTGVVRDRSDALVSRLGPVTAAAALILLGWTQLSVSASILGGVLQAAAVIGVVATIGLAARRREGWAFGLTAAAMAATVSAIFVELYPRVMVSTTTTANNLTVATTASSPYALRVMTVAAAILLPVVLAYQAWTWLVFRRRIGPADLEDRRVVRIPDTPAAEVTPQPPAPD